MRYESEAALRELIDESTRKLEAEMMNAPEGASELTEGALTALIELGDLQAELEFLRNNRDEPDAFIGVPLNHPPHLRSGGIALPEPHESES
jgi:hypothetical protein